MPARTSSAVATLALRCFPRCRYHAFSGNESNEVSQAKMLAFSFDEQGDCTQSVQIQMRSKAVVSGIPITTTIAALTSTVEGLEDRLAFNSGCYKPPKASLSHGNSAKASLPSLTRDKHDFGRFEVCSLQEYHRHVKK